MACETFMPFEEREHTADLSVTARGRNLRELILNACRGTIALIGETARLEPEEWTEVEFGAPEPERLLVGMVKQLLLEWETRGGLPVKVEVEALNEQAGQIRARLGFAHPPDLDDRIKHLPKAATYHNLNIYRTGDILEATLVLDV
ncbi:MAG: archease [Candidatus Zipacnadales bacterium]